MVRFTGYAKKEDPKWLTLLIYAGIVIAAVVLIFGVALFEQWMRSAGKKYSESKITASTSTRGSSSTTIFSETVVIEEESPITVEEVALTSRIESNQPTDSLDSIALKDYSKIYFYSKIKCSELPQTIRHVWLNPAGTVVADVRLTITDESADTWSYVNLNGAKSGNWEIQVRDTDGNVISGSNFVFY